LIGRMPRFRLEGLSRLPLHRRRRRGRVGRRRRGTRGGGEVRLTVDFERAYQQRQIRLFVLPPCSPKLNGSVERTQRTHRKEFYRWWRCPIPLGSCART
jgi:hypothetical protein